MRFRHTFSLQINTKGESRVFGAGISSAKQDLSQGKDRGDAGEVCDIFPLSSSAHRLDQSPPFGRKANPPTAQTTFHKEIAFQRGKTSSIWLPDPTANEAGGLGACPAPGDRSTHAVRACPASSLREGSSMRLANILRSSGASACQEPS